jgi:long-chain acyl-CoA synthetase
MNEKVVKYTFPALFNITLEKFGDKTAYSFVGEEPRSYSDVSAKVTALMAYLEKIGIVPGDRVAILSTNMPDWGVAYFAITFMGAIAVPILPDFSNIEAGNVLDHSESKAIFISTTLYSRIEDYKSDTLKTRLAIEDFSIINPVSEDPVYDISATGPSIALVHRRIEASRISQNAPVTSAPGTTRPGLARGSAAG